MPSIGSFIYRRKERLVIALSVFVMGGCGLAYEYTLSKISSDLLGNSARQWAIIIGVMMFFMGIGADLQKYLTKGLFDKFIIFEVVLGVLGGFAPICILYTYGALHSYFVLIQYLSISVIGLLIGLEIPLLIRINESYVEGLKYNIGGILKMDYIGALFGALLWVFILIKYFSVTETAMVLGILNVITATVALIVFNPYTFHFKKLLWGCLMSLASLGVGLSVADKWTSHAEQYLYRDRIILSKTSKYQHIVVTKSFAGEFSCYINGHLQFNSKDEYIYHENLVHPAMAIASKRKKVLVLGGGDGLAVREIIKYPDVESIILVDLDPEMTDLARNDPNFKNLNNNSLVDARLKILKNNALIESGKERIYTENQNLRHARSNGYPVTVSIVNVDAARFVEQASGLYDVIIIDFPDPNALELAKLYSKEFYYRIKKKLSAGGVFVQQSTSPTHAREAFFCIGRTMGQAGLTVIPYHDNVPSFGEWGWWIGGNKQDFSEAQIRAKIFGIPVLEVSTQYLTPDLIRASCVFGKDQLGSEKTDITTITRSRVYDYYVQGWARR